MILYLDSNEVPDIENIRPDVIRYCIEKAEIAGGRYRRLMDYYLGKHKPPKSKDNDEIIVQANYAKYVVDIVIGYYLGEPVKYDPNEIHHDKDNSLTDAASGHMQQTEGREGEKIDISGVLDVYDAQKIPRIDLEIGRTMGIMGDCLELCYASNDPEPIPKSARISPDSGILVEDSTVEHNKLFAILWDRRETVAGEKYYWVTVYTDRTEQDYRSISLEDATFFPVGERREHYFGSVPVIAYLNNEQRQGDFEQVTELIDAYNQLMSDRVTDKRKFVDSLLVFFGMSLADGQEEQMAREKFVDGAPLDARAEYIQKTFNEGEVQTLADSLVREIHKQTMTVDMSDEKFAGNSSGQALKLKLLTMSMLAKSKIRQMERGLQERFSMYNTWLNAAGRMDIVGVNDFDIVFTLSLPVNEAEVLQTVTSLQGIVDDQTLLSQLWFVRDPAEALDNVKRQKIENLVQQQELMGIFSADEEQRAVAQANMSLLRADNAKELANEMVETSDEPEEESEEIEEAE